MLSIAHCTETHVDARSRRKRRDRRRRRRSSAGSKAAHRTRCSAQSRRAWRGQQQKAELKKSNLKNSDFRSEKAKNHGLKMFFAADFVCDEMSQLIERRFRRPFRQAMQCLYADFAYRQHRNGSLHFFYQVLTKFECRKTTFLPKRRIALHSIPPYHNFDYCACQMTSLFLYVLPVHVDERQLGVWNKAFVVFAFTIVCPVYFSNTTKRHQWQMEIGMQKQRA